MTSFSFGELQHQLEASTTNNQTGVSFSGKSLKLNSEQDGKFNIVLFIFTIYSKMNFLSHNYFPIIITSNLLLPKKPKRCARRLRNARDWIT